MGDEVKLSNIEGRLERLTYPISGDAASRELEGVTLLLADGEANLGRLVGQTENDEFESVEELQTSLHNVLPREAVGEPYQSEGEG